MLQMSRYKLAAGFICRSCLRKGSNNGASRQFSGTSNQWKAVPDFAPSSTPELDALFTDFREKLFIPDSLAKQHQRLMYSPKKHVILTNEPGVTVQIGDEEEDTRLMPQNYADRPKRKDILEIINLLVECQDGTAWENIVPFFEGLKGSREKFSTSIAERVIKIGVRQGQSKHILSLFEQPKKTGFSLRYPGLARSFLLASHARASAAGFTGEDMDGVTSDVEHLAKLMERDEHCGSLSKTHRSGASPTFDNRKGLLTIGMLLEVTAARALNKQGGQDTDGQVASYVSKALALSEQGIEDGTSPHIWRKPGSDDREYMSYQERAPLTIMFNALRMAAKVEGIPTQDQTKAFNARFAALETRIDLVRDRLSTLYKESKQKDAAQTASQAASST